VLLKFDNWTLEVTDKAVLWLWNECDMPYISVLRWAGVLNILGGAVDFTEAFTKPIGLFSLVMTAIMVLLLAVIDFIARCQSPEAHNVWMAAYRVSAIARFWRWWFPIWLAANLATGDLLGAANMALGYLWVLIYSAMRPTKPRQKRRKEVKSAILAPVTVRS
jgi:hypothetical protein